MAEKEVLCVNLDEEFELDDCTLELHSYTSLSTCIKYMFPYNWKIRLSFKFVVHLYLKGFSQITKVFVSLYI